MKLKYLFMLLALVSILVAGCLVSGTFVIVEDFSFTPSNGFIGEAVDITSNDVWEDHSDKLDEIEQIGFELWMTNNSAQEWKFFAYMDEYNESCVSPSCALISTSKYLIFDTLTIPAGTGETIHITYSESLNHLVNTPQALEQLMTGKFNFYGYAMIDELTAGGQIDSVRVIITLNASDS